MRLPRLPILFSALVLAGCESGLARVAEVSVPEDVAASYTAAAPGVLVARLGGVVRWHVPLCGQTVEDPLVLVHDQLFACLGEASGPAKGDEESIRAWVEPLPAGWPADDVCAAADMSRKRHVPKPVPEGAQLAELAEEPEAHWPQAQGVGVWKRDGSPCGGQLRVRLTLE